MRAFVLAIVMIALFLTGCSGGDPAAVRSSIDGFSNPDGDVLFTLKAIEQQVDECMETGGFPDWEPGTARFAESSQGIFSLPRFERLGAELTGYSGEFGEQMSRVVEEDHDDHDHDDHDEDLEGGDGGAPDLLEAAESELLLGDGSSDLAVTYVVPGSGERSRDMGGCQGAGYREILTEEELPGFLAGEALILNLPGIVQFGALEETEVLSDWTACMSRSGITTDSPFRIGSQTIEAGDYAGIDEKCRAETGLDESFQIGLDAVLETITANAQPAIEELELIAANVRSRLSN